MSELKPIWKRLSEHLNKVFDIRDWGQGYDPLLNKTKIITSSSIWVEASLHGGQSAKERAEKLKEDFSKIAKPNAHQKVVINLAQEAIDFLEANPE